jgi:hypothetical protein
LFLLRLVEVLTHRLALKKALFVLFTPCSIGYYLTFPEKTTFRRLYYYLVILTFFLMLIGSIFVIYTHFL